MNAARFARLPLALCACLALLVPAARAATLTVTSAADDGTAGTLRAVLAAASAGDTITFALAPRTVITLTGQRLTIRRRVSIVGPIGGGVTIDGNHATQIFANIASNELRPTTISNMTLMNGDGDQGGGVANTGIIVLTNCTLIGCVADQGGGLYNTGTATLINCTVSDSTANFGGGIHNDGGSIVLVNCTLATNTTHLSVGGGIYNRGRMRLRQCTFRKNRSPDGAGVYTDGYPASITNCIFTHNRATYYGGGVYNEGLLALTNCTFTDNVAQLSGAGFYNYNKTVTVINSLFYRDQAKNDPEIKARGKVTAIACDVQGGFPGKSNIDADPQFVSPDIPRDLRLSASSPCIDAGTANGAPPFDRAGNPRDSMPDIGAFEFQP